MPASYTYLLPPERIAQRPCHPAHSAKMLVIKRESKELFGTSFFDFPSNLTSKDLLVFNDSRVIPARLFGRRGSLEVELLLLKDLGAGRWEAIGRPLRKLRENDQINFSENLNARFISRTKDEGALVEFRFGNCVATREQVLQIGLMPIPPYIREGKSDQQDLIDYQTQFARIDGSIAAPTASLHFSEELIANITDSGCNISFLTLHVGLSSIREIEPGKPPGAERFFVSGALLDKIVLTKRAGGRVIAVGTTVVRALESAARIKPNDADQDTALFIEPGFDFKIVDAMVTNFHMPGSTHLLLVEAFLKDRDLLARTYDFAMQQDFRFLSYGDGMLII
jgi:S-adenosylmethionine:tRNA ribosyltransferase-isomerase